MSDFAVQLGRIVSRHMVESRGDSEIHADIMEALAKSLGLVVAMSARGNSEAVDRLLVGIEQYIHSEAVSMSAVAAQIFTAKKNTGAQS